MNTPNFIPDINGLLTEPFYIFKWCASTNESSDYGFTNFQYNGQNIYNILCWQIHKAFFFFETKSITLYTRYVEDILIVYDSTKIVAEIISNMNQNWQNITLSPTYEDNGQTYFYF